MALSDILARPRRVALRLWRTDWLRRTGIAILIGLSLLFLALAIRDAGSAEILAAVDAADYAVVALAGLAYGLLLMLLARSWALAPASATPGIGLVQAIAVYGTSILPKYIPGSILQYGSRQYLGLRLGWNPALMAHASLLEVTLHVLCSLAIALALLLPLAAGGAGGATAWYVAVIVVAAIGAIGVLAFIGRRVAAPIIAWSALHQLAFFAGMAGLAMLCGSLFGAPASMLLPVGGLFLLSWLIGFLVPLAPGGLGVREASGVAMLSGLVGVEMALLILAAMRIISLIGDVLIFLVGLTCQRALRLTA